LNRFTCYAIGGAIVTLFFGWERSLGPVKVRAFDLVFALAVCGGMCGELARRWSAAWLRDDSVVLIAAFFLYQALNGLLLSGALPAAKETVQYLEFLLVLLVVARVTDRPESRRSFHQAMWSGIVILWLWTTFWHVSHGRWAGYKILEEAKYSYGLVAFLAVCCVLVIPPRHRWPARWFLIVAVGLMILSGERKGWVSFLAASLIITWWYGRATRSVSALSRRPLVPLALLAAPAVIVFAILPGSRAGSYVARQMASFQDVLGGLGRGGETYDTAATSSDRHRLYMLQLTLGAFARHPLFGLGTDGFKAGVARSSTVVYGVHNEYGRVAVENGLVGLALYGACWLLVLWRARFLVRIYAERADLPLLLSAGLAVYGCVLVMFVGVAAVNKMLLVVPAGLLLGYRTELERQSRNHSLRPGCRAAHSGAWV
jgi:O-antigen ligase